MVWYSQLFKNFLQFVVIHIDKSFGVVNKAEVDVFLELSLFRRLRWFSMIGCWEFDLWFLCLSKSSLNIWKFMVHILLKPGLENFDHYFTSVWDDCNCAGCTGWQRFKFRFVAQQETGWIGFPAKWCEGQLNGSYIPTFKSAVAGLSIFSEEKKFTKRISDFNLP